MINNIFIGIVKSMFVCFFCKFATELRPLIDVRIKFKHKILRIGQNIVYSLSFSRSMEGLLHVISFSNRLMPLNISLSSDIAMLEQTSDPLTLLVHQ